MAPKTTAGKPTTGSHAKGELYLDSAGTLFICTKADDGVTAAVWKKVSATAV